MLQFAKFQLTQGIVSVQDVEINNNSSNNNNNRFSPWNANSDHCWTVDLLVQELRFAKICGKWNWNWAWNVI